MGRWDDMQDREGYLAWFDAREDFKVFRDIGIDVDGWRMAKGPYAGDVLCPDCLWRVPAEERDSAEPHDPKSATACSVCGRPLNAEGDALMARARAFVEAAEAAGIGEGDTGSDDGAYDATGYAAVWLQREGDEARLFALAEEHGFELDNTNEWDFEDGNGVLYYYFPKG